MDPRYEFEAPKFVDFTKLGTSDDEDQGVDAFFDVDMETGQAVAGQINSHKVDKRKIYLFYYRYCSINLLNKLILMDLCFKVAFIVHFNNP